MRSKCVFKNLENCNQFTFSDMSHLSTGPFEVPTRKVKDVADIEIWLKSKAYTELLGFITALNKAIKGKPLSANYVVSENLAAVSNILAKVRTEIDDIPLIEQQQRFGNKAFSTLGQRVEGKSLGWLQEILPEGLKEAAAELKPYFDGSFGHFVRIDYGTGHEISFIAFCCCLFKLGFLTDSDYVAAVFKLFNEYIIFMRFIQRHYMLEPAGSQGVWGLDDYQFLPFIFGAAQLIAHPTIAPRDFTEPRIVNENYESFMFLACIKFINEVKTGPFAEHSNQLWNISAVQTWSKVNSGLIKMYKAEVLCKQPIIQHFVFGSILSIDPFTAGGGIGALRL